MKFYYKEQLIRTSKTHTYTHAAINEVDGKIYCKGCSTSEEGARKIIAKEMSEATRNLENAESAIKAIEAGKDGYFYNEGRKKSYVKFNKELTVEFYKQRIEWSKKSIEAISKWQIVELEAR